MTAREEWAANWSLPFIAMFGIAGATMFPTSVGVFMQTLTVRFGWTNAQFGASFLLQVLLSLAAMPVAGRIADRVGARKVVLFGIVPFSVSLALLGIASGSIWQWWTLCILNAACVACVSAPIWIKPIVEQFKISRGLALSVALAGIGISTALWPLFAVLYIGMFGWRFAYLGMAMTWAVPMMTLTYFFFGKRCGGAPSPANKIEKSILMRAICSRTFVLICAAGGIYAMVSYGLFIQLVPFLQTSGFSLTVAAWIVGIFGMSSIVGRVVVGILLDRLPTRFLGVVIFLLPIPATLMLLQNDGSITMALMATALFGFAGGGETDILAYLAAKRFPHTVFASIYALATSIFAVSASMGPLLAGLMFDTWQSYAPFLLLIMPTVFVGACLMACIPKEAKPPRQRSLAFGNR